jgi:hypothetical protein
MARSLVELMNIHATMQAHPNRTLDPAPPHNRSSVGWVGTSDHPDGTPVESDLFGNLDLLATLFELVRSMRFRS